MLTLTVKSTHFYLVDCKGGRLLIDAGWEMERFRAEMKAHRVAFSEIRYVMFTHTHPDHAGLIQAVRELSGAKLIIHEKQIPYLPELADFAKKKGGVTPIRVETSDLVSPTRAQLAALGILGELVETPGHSPDSISLALDNGAAFIGDLTSPFMVDESNQEEVFASWRKLIDLNVQVFYHAHTPPIPVQTIKNMIS